MATVREGNKAVLLVVDVQVALIHKRFNSSFEQTALEAVLLIQQKMAALLQERKA